MDSEKHARFFLENSFRKNGVPPFDYGHTRHSLYDVSVRTFKNQRSPFPALYGNRLRIHRALRRFGAFHQFKIAKLALDERGGGGQTKSFFPFGYVCRLGDLGAARRRIFPAGQIPARLGISWDLYRAFKRRGYRLRRLAEKTRHANF